VLKVIEEEPGTVGKLAKRKTMRIQAQPLHTDSM
jgi:hypothetical protein